jgi:hypothetical protein
MMFSLIFFGAGGGSVGTVVGGAGVGVVGSAGRRASEDAIPILPRRHTILERRGLEISTRAYGRATQRLQFSVVARTDVFGPTPIALEATIRTWEDILLLSSPTPSSFTTTWSERKLDGPPAQGQKRRKHKFQSFSFFFLDTLFLKVSWGHPLPLHEQKRAHERFIYIRQGF